MEIYELIQEFVKPELLVLIPVLYLIGTGFKKTTLIKDKFIPVILGLVGVLLTGLWVFATTPVSGAREIIRAIVTALTQGVLLAGAAVYANQVYKQLKN